MTERPKNSRAGPKGEGKEAPQWAASWAGPGSPLATAAHRRRGQQNEARSCSPLQVLSPREALDKGAAVTAAAATAAAAAAAAPPRGERASGRQGREESGRPGCAAWGWALSRLSEVSAAEFAFVLLGREGAGVRLSGGAWGVDGTCLHRPQDHLSRGAAG